MERTFVKPGNLNTRVPNSFQTWQEEYTHYAQKQFLTHKYIYILVCTYIYGIILDTKETKVCILAIVIYDTNCIMAINIMVIRVVKFSSGGYKIRKIFAKESTYPKEIIEF